MVGRALSRYTNGIHTIRALISLQGLTGNLIGSGKGIMTMEGGKPEGEKEFVDAMCGEAQAQGVNFRRLLALMKKGSLDVLFLNSSYRRYPDAKGVRECPEKGQIYRASRLLHGAGNRGLRPVYPRHFLP